ncbi:DDE-type integrase/transposase/recombinase [Priestia megaterium]|nr:DDE-type integrase/transposase/recombinase [Priestia megaterium]MDC7783202.1 DDE-type integrase/transposase/recombinase [Priestia megaterium]
MYCTNVLYSFFIFLEIIQRKFNSSKKTRHYLKSTNDSREIRYLNNIVEQDYHFIKKLICPMLKLKHFHTAKTLLLRYKQCI